MTTGGSRSGSKPGGVVRVHVAPQDHPWHEEVSAAARRAGAELAPPQDSTALVWLSNDSGDDLHDLLHGEIEWVQLRSAGVEKWMERGDLDRKRQWTAARGVYAQAVAEHALALVLAGLKLLPEYARASTWDEGSKRKGRLVRDATVVVMGAGGIGHELIRYLAPLGARTVAITRSGREVAGAHENLPSGRFLEILPRADVLVLAAPATPETEHLVSTAELAALPADALLVNIARGSLVDTRALLAALRCGGIGGAALDVTDPEPLPDGHPLWEEPRALITPHAANPAAAQLPRLCALVEENLRRFANGQQLQGRVDIDTGY